MYGLLFHSLHSVSQRAEGPNLTEVQFIWFFSFMNLSA